MGSKAAALKKLRQIKDDDVIDAYRRWAPVYDVTFGRVAEAGRKHAVRLINRRQGSVLEVGVGTGLSLPFYGEHLTVTGIDLSPDMLQKARARVDRRGVRNVAGLHEMDAGNLAFEDDSFDTVVAMYVMTVVPDPDRVMRELERVCAPGGEVILVNHFSQDDGMRGWVERRMSPLAHQLGWHPVFPMQRVLGFGGLRLAERRALKPFGLFTMLRFVKEPGYVPDGVELEVRAPRTRLKPAHARPIVMARRIPREAAE
jgi:phosphatidylethanolamine/phosphatidyl-N-methylethanolamine N-methyltransferase